MGRVEKPALKGSWLGKLLIVLNPLVRILLGSPFHWPLSMWFLLLAWTGRRTGRTRSTPVSYVRDEAGMWVTTGDRWPSFVVGNPSLRVRYKGRWSPGQAELVAGPETSLREHERIFSEHGWFRVLAGIPKRAGRPDAMAIGKAVASGRRLIRIELA